MYKNRYLIALDLDGTLLTEKKNITKENIQTIKHLQKKGHVIVIATGRSNHSSLDYYDELNLETPIINFNGALIYHPKNKDWGVFHETLPLQIVLKIVELCQRLDAGNIIVKADHYIYIDQYEQKIIDLYQSNNQARQRSKILTGSIHKRLNKNPTTLLLKLKDEKLETVIDTVEKNFSSSIELRSWGGPWNVFEITPKGINKGVALKKLADHYKIPQTNTIAFGDQINDIEMIEYAGVGVAMKNAIQPLKKVADDITSSNEENGVAQFLNHYLIKNPQSY